MKIKIGHIEKDIILKFGDIKQIKLLEAVNICKEYENKFDEAINKGVKNSEWTKKFQWQLNEVEKLLK